MSHDTKEEIDYNGRYTTYNRKLSANIFIPSNTDIMVWYHQWQFNRDFTDYEHMWDSGERRFYIPDHILSADTLPAKKDITIPMVLASILADGRVLGHGMITHSRIAGDLMGVDVEDTSYGLWVKLYKNPTYIPELHAHIIAYGVYEVNLPMVNECFKYNQCHSLNTHTRIMNP